MNTMHMKNTLQNKNDQNKTVHWFWSKQDGYKLAKLEVTLKSGLNIRAEMQTPDDINHVWHVYENNQLVAYGETTDATGQKHAEHVICSGASPQMRRLAALEANRLASISSD